MGPVYHGKDKDAVLLKRCYTNSFDLAKQNGIRSISFSAISTGVYGYPLMDATYIALNSVLGWLKDNADYEISVEFCCFDENAYFCYKGIYKILKG